MSLPGFWTDSIFERLALRYGAAFMRQYEGIDPMRVKSDWGDVLGGFSRADIQHALAHLPADRPPNVMVMRDLCRRAPREALALAAPDVPADPERAAALVASVKRQQPGVSAAQQCLDNILLIVRDRAGKWSMGQRRMVQTMHEAGMVDASAHGFTNGAA